MSLTILSCIVMQLDLSITMNECISWQLLIVFCNLSHYSESYFSAGAKVCSRNKTILSNFLN
jgi:hypothetical protein